MSQSLDAAFHSVQLETHSLRNIFSLIEEGDLCLQPKYQR
jgi:hypothetical protein